MSEFGIYHLVILSIVAAFIGGIPFGIWYLIRTATGIRPSPRPHTVYFRKSIGRSDWLLFGFFMLVLICGLLVVVNR